MSKIIVLQGVPASGKSTYARKFVKDNPNYVIVSRDAIRESRGDYWIPCQENYISDVEELQIKAAIDNQLNVIIDATNLNPKTIQKWINLANILDSEIEFIKFEIGYKEALERDKKRKEEGKRSVGEKVMKNFFKNYFPEELNKSLRFIDNRIIKQPSNLPKCIICDIDGTISLNNGRSPYDYSKVNEDKIDSRMQQLLEIFKDYNGKFGEIKIIFLSGREATLDCRLKTGAWITKKFFYSDNYTLYMRKEGDHRKDSIVKKELYETHIKDNYDVLCWFDDRNQVVDMVREEGLLCCQVYYGDF